MSEEKDLYDYLVELEEAFENWQDWLKNQAVKPKTSECSAVQIERPKINLDELPNGLQRGEKIVLWIQKIILENPIVSIIKEERQKFYIGIAEKKSVAPYTTPENLRDYAGYYVLFSELANDVIKNAFDRIKAGLFHIVLDFDVRPSRRNTKFFYIKAFKIAPFYLVYLLYYKYYKKYKEILKYYAQVNTILQNIRNIAYSSSLPSLDF